MSKKNPNARQKSAVSRRLVVRYLAAIVIYAAALAVFVMLLWQFFSSFNWREDDPVYIVLHFVQEYILGFGGGTLLLGWVIIMYRFFAKPLSYLDEVVAATEQLIAPTNEPIVLSGDMYHTETELNRVREKALENMHAAREAEQRKNDLVMYLAHDLKTPLSFVIGYLTLLHDEGEISPELREKYLGIALDKAERLEELINEFFEITRFNLSEITLQYSRIDLTRLLEQLTFEFQPMLQEKNLTCALSAPESLPLRCDPDKLERVFDNLLRNAVLYSYPGSEIAITAESRGNEAVIRFCNRGDTIPPEKLARIFEQFYRLDAARSSHGGAGLGLAIAKQIVELHGGTIGAESADERVEFTVTLPLS